MLNSQTNNQNVALEDLLKMRDDIIRESISDVFDYGRHMERVGTVNGVSYINDAGSESIEATKSALLKIDGEVVWIAARPDRLEMYEELYELVNEKVKAIICIVEDDNEIFRLFGNSKVKMIINVSSVVEAVKAAYLMAVEGDNVLFSPAAPNPDAVDYENWAMHFKKAVKSLEICEPV